MENKTNEELLQQLEIMAGQLALAINDHNLRKEKQYSKKVLQLELEILNRMER